MKGNRLFLFFIAQFLGLFYSFGQIKTLNIQELNLPPDISYYDNQFSSLYVSNGNLFLMSECRIQDHSPAFIAWTPLKEIKKNLKDTSYQPTFHRINIANLEIIKSILEARNQAYEGLEAMVIGNKNDFYFSIETATPSDSCYIIKAILRDSILKLDTNKLLGIAKPLDQNGKHIYNAGFESMELTGNKIFAFFEYNYFPKNNKAVQFSTDLSYPNIQTFENAKVPFRITDVSWSKNNKSLWAINYFYDGGGGDTIYRLPKTDPDFPLTVKNGHFNSYTRIIKLQKQKDHFTYQVFGKLPEPFWQYNWEGIAQYKNGVFMINDKYTPKRPYKSVLVYVKD